MDTDLELLSTVEDIFEILKSVDLVGCHAPVRWSDWKSVDVPEGFSELNSGVLGIRRCSRQRELVRYWLRLYDQVGIEFDQATLRAAIWWSVSQRVWKPGFCHQNTTYAHQNRGLPGRYSSKNSSWQISRKV